jgi:hypothetical protein
MPPIAPRFQCPRATQSVSAKNSRFLVSRVHCTTCRWFMPSQAPVACQSFSRQVMVVSVIATQTRTRSSASRMMARTRESLYPPSPRAVPSVFLYILPLFLDLIHRVQRYYGGRDSGNSRSCSTIFWWRVQQLRTFIYNSNPYATDTMSKFAQPTYQQAAVAAYLASQPQALGQYKGLFNPYSYFPSFNSFKSNFYVHL